MTVKIVIVLVMALVLLAWCVFCSVMFYRNCRNKVAEGDFPVHVKCEKCGGDYQITPEEFSRSHIVKSVSRTRTKVRGAALVNSPEYSYFAKKFRCPHCGKKAYGKIENIDEFRNLTEKTAVSYGVRWLVAMAAGGIVIMLISAVLMGIVDIGEKKRIQNLKEKRYEQFIKDYDLKDISSDKGEKYEK